MTAGIETPWPLVPLSRGTVAMCDGPFGSSLTSAHYTPKGPRVIRLGNIGQASFRDGDEARISNEHFAALGRHAVRTGDLLVAGLGDENNPLGRACVAPAGLGPAIVKADCFRFRLSPIVFDPRFVAWALSSSVGEFAVRAISRGSTRSRANLGGIAAIRVPCPPVVIQTTVADFLDAETARIDALVAARRHQASLLTARRASLMFAAVSGSLGAEVKRRPSGVPWLSTLPEGWAELKLTRVARLGSGHTPSRSRPEWWRDCTIPWITTGEVAQIRDDRREVLSQTRENISEIGLANSAAELRPAGTVVLSRTASAGYSAIMGTDMATSQDFVTWTCSERLLPRFLLFCLRAMRPDLLGRLAMGSTHRTIYFPDIESIRIPLPSVGEQQRMLDLADSQLEALSPLEASIDRQITLLRERRQALITGAVTGKLDVG